MKKYNSKMLKLLNLQLIAGLINALITCILSIFIMFEISENVGWFFAIISGIIFAWFFVRFLNIMSLLLFKWIVYGSNTNDLIQDTNDFSKMINGEIDKLNKEKDSIRTIETQIKILALPDQPIGKFNGIDFYEWLVIDDGLTPPRKVYFHGTTDMKDGKSVDAELSIGSIVIPPGLIYEEKAINEKI